MVGAKYPERAVLLLDCGLFKGQSCVFRGEGPCTACEKAQSLDLGCLSLNPNPSVFYLWVLGKLRNFSAFRFTHLRNGGMTISAPEGRERQLS